MNDPLERPVQDEARPRRDWALVAHRWIGLLAIPFLLTSIVLATGLSHPRWLERWSDALWNTLPIPVVALDEPVRPGSWEQALRLANLAVGKQGHVITTRDDGAVVVQAFESHSHDPAVARVNRHIKVTVDLQSMKIVRVDDRDSSLSSIGHGIHAWRFMDWPHASLTTVSSIALLALAGTGIGLAWQRRRAGQALSAAARRHNGLGWLLSLFMVSIALTSLALEYGWWMRSDRSASHPVPAVAIDGPVQAGSLDQARALAEKAAGAPMRTVFLRGNNDWKFSEVGDGIGGQSVWFDAEQMQVKRITDWRNDRQALVFILHDGRWLGGMNALNIHDAVALLLVVLMAGGVLLRRRPT